MSPRISKPIARPGLTLLEVLAALALLAIITAACLPLLAEARRYSDTIRDADQFETLVVIADAVVFDPEIFGLDAKVMVLDGFSAVIGNPDTTQYTLPPSAKEELLLETVTVRLLGVIDLGDDNDETLTHGWLEFRLGDDVTLRYIELPDTPEPEEVFQ